MENGQHSRHEGHHIARRTIVAAGVAALGSIILSNWEQAGRPDVAPSAPTPEPTLLPGMTPVVPTTTERPAPSTATTHEPTQATTPTPSETQTSTHPPTPTTSSTTATPRDTQNFAPRKMQKILPKDRFIARGPSSRANVSITVDDFFGKDGADYLDGLLDIGKRYKVPFTMFPTGGALDTHNRLGYSDLWRRTADAGHAIGNHTYHHYIGPDFPYKTFAGLQPQEMHNELELTRLAFYRVLGSSRYDMYLMRPPGGSGGYPSKRQEHAYALGQVAQEGYYMTMWTTDSNDPRGRIVTPDQDNRFLKKIFTDKNEGVRNGSIILLHPTTLSLNGVEKLIQGLREREFTCRTVPGLFI